MSGTPRPNKKGTYDFSSSVMNSKAPPLRPEEKRREKSSEEERRVKKKVK